MDEVYVRRGIVQLPCDQQRFAVLASCDRSLFGGSLGGSAVDGIRQ